MRFLKKATLGLCLTWVISMAVFGIVLIFDTEETPTGKRSITLGLLMMATPAVALGGWLWWDLRSQHQKRLQAQAADAAARLQDTFYQLLESQQGEITVFQFARETDLPAAEAEAYLNEQAQAFQANFRVGDHNEVIYQFPVG